VQRAAAAHVSDEVLAVDPLHRKEPLPLFARELAEPHEVLVLEIRQRAKLVFEAKQILGRQRRAKTLLFDVATKNALLVGRTPDTLGSSSGRGPARAIGRICPSAHLVGG
jgi:hypothetical protein